MNIGEMQRKLSLWAEQDPGRKFYGLFDLICHMDWLRLACEYVSQNAGSKTAGCDGIDMQGFNRDREGNLARLQELLQSDTFEACPVRRVYIPKANGKVRPLGIPTIRDRVVQEAVRMALEPIFEADFSQLSFGFRPNRCAMDAVSHLLNYARKGCWYFWAIEGDISAYFDTICHRKLMKLLRRRVKDERLLDLIWKFLRSGVMERRLFKETSIGTPQGGIASPLLANVYLHELDKFMEGYTGLSDAVKVRRRRQGLANFAYARYADDFVILCNGTEEQAKAMREEVRNFLAHDLRLTLSMEKTKVTHLDEGFDFLGFHLRRGLGLSGVVTKLTISRKALRRHRAMLWAATAADTHEDSFATKIPALNRIIRGWCRYFQHVATAQTQFAKLDHETFWRVAHWLGRKHRLSMPSVLARFYTKARGSPRTLGEGKVQLIKHTSIKYQRYRVRLPKPNPYTTQRIVTKREELLDDRPWLGTEARPGMTDLRPLVLERDGYKCCICKAPVTSATAQVDHLRPVCSFRRPVDANCLDNLWTLCIPCHQQKTESDRQMESRMR